MKETPLVNRIAKSKLVTIDPGKYYPKDIFHFDLKDFLFHGLILKEKEFRLALDEYNWAQVSDRRIHISCSADAIVPLWAYMLVASKAAFSAKSVFYGDQASHISNEIVTAILKEIPLESIYNGKYVIKGCSDYEISPHVYSALTQHLAVHGARSIMFGEPCSTVPIYKKIKK